MEKDRLCTEIAKQRRRKERLAADVVKVVVESNSLYIRTEKSINYKQPLQMHQRLEQSPTSKKATLTFASGQTANTIHIEE